MGNRDVGSGSSTIFHMPTKVVVLSSPSNDSSHEHDNDKDSNGDVVEKEDDDENEGEINEKEGAGQQHEQQEKTITATFLNSLLSSLGASDPRVSRMLLALTCSYLDSACSEKGEPTPPHCPHILPETVRRLTMTAMVLAHNRLTNSYYANPDIGRYAERLVGLGEYIGLTEGTVIEMAHFLSIAGEEMSRALEVEDKEKSLGFWMDKWVGDIGGGGGGDYGGGYGSKGQDGVFGTVADATAAMKGTKNSSIRVHGVPWHGVPMIPVFAYGSGQVENNIEAKENLKIDDKAMTTIKEEGEEAIGHHYIRRESC